MFPRIRGSCGSPLRHPPAAGVPLPPLLDGVNWLAACPAYGDSNGIYQSTNSGKNWEQTIAWQTNGWSAIAWSADGTRRVAADPGGGFVPARLFTSVDAGVNWVTTMLSYDGWNSLAASKDGSKWMATSLYVGGV